VCVSARAHARVIVCVRVRVYVRVCEGEINREREGFECDIRERYMSEAPHTATRCNVLLHTVNTATN